MVSVSCFGVRFSVMFHFMFVHYTFSSVWDAEWSPFDVHCFSITFIIGKLVYVRLFRFFGSDHRLRSSLPLSVRICM